MKSDPHPDRDGSFEPASRPEHPNIGGHDPAELIQSAAEAAQPSSANPSAREWQPPQLNDLADLMPGYRIVELLGRGGMGAVYKGVQESLDREVAIKLLPPELGADPEFETRFRREALAMARLNHPNIVQIHDFGQTTAGHHFFVMEFVDGSDLQHLIRSGELEPEGALNAVSQICDALEYAHDEGFVHRDIKPANIFINNKGILKVGDFGLAKLVDGENQAGVADQLGLTMTGVAMGTLHYIAPEQMTDGNSVDRRADIYSLGVMFYEMLTGEIPRGAVKAPSQKFKVAKPDKSLDVRIDGVVFKAMESDPEERYQSATDLRTDVDGIRMTPLPDEVHEESESVGVGESQSGSTKAPHSKALKGEKKSKAGLITATLTVMLLTLGAGAVLFLKLRGDGDAAATANVEESGMGILPMSDGKSSSSSATGPSPSSPSAVEVADPVDSEPSTAFADKRAMPPSAERRGYYTGELPPTPVTFPLKDPIGYPPLPTTKCRIVIIVRPEKQSGLEELSFSAVEKADYSDVVKLGDEVRSSVVAIRMNGIPALWTSGGALIEGTETANARAAWQFSDRELVWIDSDNKIHGLNVRPENQAIFGELSNVVRLNRFGVNSFFIISDQGKRTCIFPDGADFSIGKLFPMGLDNVLEMKSGGTNTISWYTNEGNVTMYWKEKTTVSREKGDVAYWLNWYHARLSDGSVVAFDRYQSMNKWLSEFPSSISNISKHTGAHGMIALQKEKDRSWEIWSGDENSKDQWQPDQKYNTAFKGAVEIRLQDHSGRYIYALLPADTVSRSGLWDIDELIADREKIRAAASITSTPPRQGQGTDTGRMPVPLSDPIGARIAEIDAQFDARYQTEVGKGHADAVAQLDTQISAALQREQDTASNAGNLDTVLQWKRAIDRLASGKGVPTKVEIDAEDPPVTRPEKLLVFFQTYRQQLARIEAARDEKAKPLLKARDQELDKYQRELTIAGNIQGAVSVKAARATAPAQLVPEAPTEAVAKSSAATSRPASERQGTNDLLEANKKRYQIDYSRSGTLKVAGTAVFEQTLQPVSQPSAEEASDVCFVAACYTGLGNWLAVKRDGGIIGGGPSSMEIPSGVRNPRWLHVGQQAIAVHEDGEVSIFGWAQWQPRKKLRNVVKGESGERNSIALHEDGTVSVWGPLYDDFEPEPEWLHDVADVAAGRSCAWVLKSNGQIIGWNALGELANQDDSSSSNASEQQDDDLPRINSVAISGSGTRLLRLNSEGRLARHDGPIELEDFRHNVGLAGMYAGNSIDLGITDEGRIAICELPEKLKQFPTAVRPAVAARGVIAAAAAGDIARGLHFGFIAWVEENQ